MCLEVSLIKYFTKFQHRTDIKTTHQSKNDMTDCKLFVLTVWISIGTGRRGVTEFFDEPLRGFVCERAAVQSAEFVLIQHMVKIAWGILGVSQVYGNVTLYHQYIYLNMRPLPCTVCITVTHAVTFTLC